MSQDLPIPGGMRNKILVLFVNESFSLHLEDIFIGSQFKIVSVNDETNVW